MDDAAVLDLNDFFYFVQVVDRSGFTAAGRMLRIPKSTLSHRIQRLENELGVRLLNRTSRRFAMTDAGEEFYRHAVVMLHDAESAESAIRHRLTEPTGTVRCTAAMATMQFAMCDIVADFLLRYPKVNVVAHATDRNVDIVGENYDVAIRALKQAAIAGLGVVALPGYVCREDVRLGALRHVLPAWLAGDSTITALVPYRRGLLPSVRVFIDHLSAELPKRVLL
jgi:DNA-binding transcriptional LysR family regulator